MNYKKQKEQSNQYREELTHRCNLIIQFYMEHYTPGDPISKIIPNYWNNTQNRAIKDVLFTRIKKLRIKL